MSDRTYASPDAETATNTMHGSNGSPGSHGAERRLGDSLAHAAGSFVPLLLVSLTLVVWLVYQMALLGNEHNTLAATRLAQQPTVDNAVKLRASLDALAADTQRLADSGNASAAQLVAELRKRGITINPNAQTAGAAASSTSSR